MPTILDTPITDTKLPTTWVPSAGSDRLGIVFTHYEANSATFPDDLADTISWRGQALTRIARQTAFDGGTGSCVDLWVLNEAGIAAGEVVGSGGFTSTIPSGGGISNSGTWGSTVLTIQDANQSADLTTRIATATAATPATPMPHSIGINGFANDLVLFGATTSVPDSLTWVNATEDTDTPVYSAYQTSVAHATPNADGLITASVEAAAGNSYGTCLVAVTIPPAAVAPAASITGASSNSTADVAHAGSTLTITVDDSAGVGSATINGVAMSNVAIFDATTVTATVPVDINLAAGSSADVIVNNGTNSNAYSVTFLERIGYSATTFTVDHANLSASSPFSIGDFSDIVSGDICVYESSVDGYAVAMSGDGIFTLTGAPAGSYDIDYYFRDASDSFNSSLAIETITIDAGVNSPPTVAPTITPTAGETISQVEGSAYSDPAWTWNDDIVSGQSVSWSGDTVLINTPGVYTRTATATNIIGTTTLNYTVTITAAVATVSPTITPTAGTTISQIEGVAYTDPSWTWADDIVSDQSVSWSGDTVDTNTPGVYVRTATAVNVVGTTTLDYTITITASSATVAPTITPTAGVTIDIEEGGSYSDPSWLWADDFVSDQAVTWSGDTVDVNTPAVYVRTATATNNIGTTQLDYTVTITESLVVVIAPVINPTAGDIMRVIIGSTYSDPAWTWSDNIVSGQAVTWAGSTVDVNTLGSYTRTASGTNTIGTTGRDLTINVINQPSGSGSGSAIGTL